MSALATYGRTVIDVDDGDGDGGRVWTAFMMMRRTRGCGSLSSAAPPVRENLRPKISRHVLVMKKNQEAKNIERDMQV
jgi:predicted phosphoribosyltransferase